MICQIVSRTSKQSMYVSLCLTWTSHADSVWMWREGGADKNGAELVLCCGRHPDRVASPSAPLCRFAEGQEGRVSPSSFLPSFTSLRCTISSCRGRRGRFVDPPHHRCASGSRRTRRLSPCHPRPPPCHRLFLSHAQSHVSVVLNVREDTFQYVRTGEWQKGSVRTERESRAESSGDESLSQPKEGTKRCLNKCVMDRCKISTSFA